MIGQDGVGVRAEVSVLQGRNGVDAKGKSISADGSAAAVKLPNKGQWVLMWSEQVLLTVGAP